jgi:hypothetical protein
VTEKLHSLSASLMEALRDVPADVAMRTIDQFTICAREGGNERLAQAAAQGRVSITQALDESARAHVPVGRALQPD